mmetsp:Transcript_16884/g.33732  ORF Transcript_16884/g.33732 Transcript_16884/m.33732 type:complete len:417 (-) Transcript_16884:212-1462(-)
MLTPNSFLAFLMSPPPFPTTAGRMSLLSSMTVTVASTSSPFSLSALAALSTSALVPLMTTSDLSRRAQPPPAHMALMPEPLSLRREPRRMPETGTRSSTTEFSWITTSTSPLTLSTSSLFPSIVTLGSSPLKTSTFVPIASRALILAPFGPITTPRSRRSHVIVDLCTSRPFAASSKSVIWVGVPSTVTWSPFTDPILTPVALRGSMTLSSLRMRHLPTSVPTVTGRDWVSTTSVTSLTAPATPSAPPETVRTPSLASARTHHFFSSALTLSPPFPMTLLSLSPHSTVSVTREEREGRLRDAQRERRETAERSWSIAGVLRESVERRESSWDLYSSICSCASLNFSPSLIFSFTLSMSFSAFFSALRGCVTLSDCSRPARREWRTGRDVGGRGRANRTFKEACRVFISAWSSLRSD